MAHNNYTMSTRGSSDMHTLSPRALGVHIRQTIRVHGITITCTSAHSEVIHFEYLCITLLLLNGVN